jgi:predicted esterase
VIRELLFIACFFIVESASAADSVAVRKDSMGRDYWLYTPSKVIPTRDYWLVVGVHGYGGNGDGAAGLASWTKQRDCYVLGPSFPNNGYQLLLQDSDTQLVKLIEDLRKTSRFKPRVFLFGFSGGAQFVHRFTQKYPTLVAGCAAHSAGTWATGGQWGELNPEARTIPLVISCGQRDTDKSVPQAPFGRIEWARQFEQQLKSGGFAYAATYPKDAGHNYSPEAISLTEICFKSATGKAETLAAQRTAVAALLAKGDKVGAEALVARSKVRIAALGPNVRPEATLEMSLGVAHNAALEAMVSEGKVKISK